MYVQAVCNTPTIVYWFIGNWIVTDSIAYMLKQQKRLKYVCKLAFTYLLFWWAASDLHYKNNN